MLTQNISKGFSREAMKKAVTEETITQEGDVELNELATQVAEQFSADYESAHWAHTIIADLWYFGVFCWQD